MFSSTTEQNHSQIYNHSQNHSNSDINVEEGRGIDSSSPMELPISNASYSTTLSSQQQKAHNNHNNYNHSHNHLEKKIDGLATKSLFVGSGLGIRNKPKDRFNPKGSAKHVLKNILREFDG